MSLDEEEREDLEDDDDEDLELDRSFWRPDPPVVMSGAKIVKSPIDFAKGAQTTTKAT